MGAFKLVSRNAYWRMNRIENDVCVGIQGTFHIHFNIVIERGKGGAKIKIGNWRTFFFSTS